MVLGPARQISVKAFWLGVLRSRENANQMEMGLHVVLLAWWLELLRILIFWRKSSLVFWVVSSIRYISAGDIVRKCSSCLDASAASKPPSSQFLPQAVPLPNYLETEGVYESKDQNRRKKYGFLSQACTMAKGYPRPILDHPINTSGAHDRSSSVGCWHFGLMAEFKYYCHS